MEFHALGLIHPEWDSEITDDEFLARSKPDPLLGTFHGLSSTLYGHLPHNVKVQLTLQQKRIDILGGNLVRRVQEVMTAPVVEGGSFYNESTGRDLSALCKAVSRSQTKFYTPLPRQLRHAAIRALFDFVVRHANPELIFHPKALRAAMPLLSELIQAEVEDLGYARAYKTFKEHKLVPDVNLEFPRLTLEWRPLYDLYRTAWNHDNDRRRSTHYQGIESIPVDLLDALIMEARHLFPAEGCSEVLETIFPFISLKPESTLESVMISASKSNEEMVDDLMRLSKDESFSYLSLFLPLPLHDSDIDYHLIIDQVLNLWRIVPASIAWDRNTISSLEQITSYSVIRWKPNQVRMVLEVPLRQLQLATAGTPLATPGNNTQTPSLSARPLGRALGKLIVSMIATDELYEKSLTDASVSVSETTLGIFLQWVEQIETYLHPNSSVPGARTLKNILLGIVEELMTRYRTATIVNDYERFAASVKEFSNDTQGIYNTRDLPHILHGSLKDYIIKESTWDALLPVFDRLRVHLAESSLSTDMSFLLAHLRPEYIHKSIFPRAFYALENPMLDGRLNVPASMKILTGLVPLLVNVPGAPARLTDLLYPLLPHVDPNDPQKAAQTFNLVMALMKAITERKRGQTEHSSHYLKQIEAITLPSDLASTLVGKSFTELKARLLHQVKPVAYHPPFTALAASSDSEDNHGKQAQLDSELLTLESVLSDWVVEFFESVLHFIEGVPRGSSSSSSLVHCIKSVLEFAILGGESLFNILLRSLTDTITSTPRAKTDLNPLVDAFSRVRPNLVLGACFESWLNDVKKRGQQTKAGKKQLESEAEVMAWKLDLLRLILKRSGLPIGTHEKTLLSIIDPLLKDEDKSIRRAALHVLSAGLGPMKPAYNTHADPAASGKFNTFVDVLLMHATFIEPTRHSLEQAARWTTHFIQPAIKALSDATDLYRDALSAESAEKEKTETGTEASTSVASDKPASSVHTAIAPPKDLNEHLQLLFEFITALGPVLPMKQPENKPISLAISQHLPFPEESPAAVNEMVVTEEAVIKQRQALIPPALSVLTHTTREEALPEELKNLRWDIIFAVQEFVALAVLTGRCREPKTVRRAMKVFTQALVHNGAKEAKWADKLSRLPSASRHLNESTDGSGRTKSKAKQEKEDSRLEASAKAGLPISYQGRDGISPLEPYYMHTRYASSSLLQARWAAARSKLQFGEVATGLVRAYVMLTSNHVELIRSRKLAKLLLENIPRFGGSIPFLNGLLLKIISTPLNANQSLTSFATLLATLSAPFALPNLVANWKNFAHFVKTIRGLHIHDHALLQKAIVRFYAIVLDSLPLRSATPLQDRNFFLSYADLTDSLVADLSSERPTAHWRYHLYSLITLCAILRRNVHTPGVKLIDPLGAPPRSLSSSIQQSSDSLAQSNQGSSLRASQFGNLDSDMDSLSRQISSTSLGLTESQEASFQPISLVASAVGSEAIPAPKPGALSRYRPGLDGLAVLKALVPVLSDVLPTARGLARFIVTRILSWAQDAEDASHAEVIAPLLEEEQMNSLLGIVVIDRQARPGERDPLEAIVSQIILSDSTGDYFGIGDSEFGVGMDIAHPSTFNFRIADLWYRLFSSLKFTSSSREEALKRIASFLTSKLQENLGATPNVSTLKPILEPSSPAPAAHPTEIKAPVPIVPSTIVTEVSDSPVPNTAIVTTDASTSESSAPSKELIAKASKDETKTSLKATADKPATKEKVGAKKPAPKKKAPSAASPSPEHVEEMESYFFSLSEAMVGFTRAFPEEGQQHVWTAILGGSRLSTKRLSSLLYGIGYLVHYKTTLDLLEEKLLEPVFRDASDLGSLNVFDIEARLSLILCLYQESRYSKLSALANLVKHLFIDRHAAAIPKPQIRSIAVHLLTLLSAMITRSSFAIDEMSKKAIETHDRIIESLLEAATTETVFDGNLDPNSALGAERAQSASPSVATTSATATGSLVPVTPQDRIKSTLIAWMSSCLDNRIEILTNKKWWTRLTEVALDLSIDPATAVAKSAEKVLIRLSQLIVLPFSELEEVELVKQVATIKRLVSEHPRWKARSSMCLAMRFFLFNHSILLSLSERTDIIDWEKHLIEDSHVDVRKAATAALASTIRSLCPPDAEMKNLASYYLEIASKNNAKAKTKAREGKDDVSASAESVNALICATSGLVALASACPYTVPSWLPPVVLGLQRLSTHSNGTVTTLASDAIVQFWKTHRDEWHFHQSHFSADELRVLEDKPVPSYYA